MVRAYIRFDPMLRVHARTSGNEILLGPKFGDLLPEGRDATIAHEYGHVLTERDHALGVQVIDTDLWQYGKNGRHEREGMFGFGTPEEQWADAVAAYLLTPAELRKRNLEVYALVERYVDVSEAQILMTQARRLEV